VAQIAHKFSANLFCIYDSTDHIMLK
jgi:hypothetical protein